MEIQQPTPITRPSEPSELKKERTDKGQPRITTRDRELLKFIGEQYTVRLDQLHALINQSEEREEKTVRNLVARWRDAQWVISKKIYADQPLYIWLTKEGLQVAELDFRHSTPSPNMLNHYAQVTNVRLKIKVGQWRSERYLWANLNDDEKRERKHIADAEIITATGQVQAVEVELTAKHSERIKKIIDTLLDNYPIIYYFCSKDSLVTVEKAVSQLAPREREKIKVASL